MKGVVVCVWVVVLEWWWMEVEGGQLRAGGAAARGARGWRMQRNAKGEWEGG